MSERSLNRPLSGAEVVDIICQQIRKQLSRDCYLNPILSYASFSWQCDLRVQFQNTQTAITSSNAHIEGAGGEVTPEIDMDAIDVSISGDPAAPNQLRVENDMGVPVLATKPSGGMEEKRVKYAAKGRPAMTARKALEEQ